MKLPKHLQVKKEHHYVWANYLRNWSDTNKIWFLSGKGKLVNDSTKMIAKERFFYNMRPLKSEHIEHIKRMAMYAHPEVQEIHLGYLSDFIMIQRVEQLSKSTGITNSEIEAHIAAAKGNLLENIHTSHENDVKDILKDLSQGDLSTLDSDENMIKFCAFLGHQFARTKTFKERSSLVTSKMPNMHPEQARLIEISKECWWFTSLMIGINFGSSLYLNRKQEQYCMLVNDTSEPFITSDQPAINVHPSIAGKFRVPQAREFDLYYPLSPKYGLVVCNSGRFPKGKSTVDLDIVRELNAKIARNAHIHIFGSSDQVLRPYIKHVGSRDKWLKEHDLTLEL